MRIAPNFPLMMFSLLISISLWLVVFAKDKAPPEPIFVKVDYTGLNQEKWHIDHDDPNASLDEIKLYFTGPEDRLDDIKRNPPEVYVSVDLTEPKEGTKLYSAHLTPTRYEQYAVKDAPLQIRVKLESVISNTVPVEISPEGGLKDPNLDVDLQFSPEKVTVTGPRSQVERVVKCVGNLDVSQISPEAGRQAVSIQAIDSNKEVVDVKIGSPYISVTPILTARPQNKTALVNVPIFGQPGAGYMTDGYDFTPTSVLLSGKPAVLARISTIDTEPVDVTGLTMDKVFRVRLTVPLQIQLKTRSPYVTVRYHVRPNPSYRGAPPASSTGSSDFPSTMPPLSGSRRGGN